MADKKSNLKAQALTITPEEAVGKVMSDVVSTIQAIGNRLVQVNTPPQESLKRLSIRLGQPKAG